MNLVLPIDIDPADGAHVNKARIPLADARAIALGYKALLQPVCSQIAVAGSIRRQKPDVGDIELVACEKAPGLIFHELYRYSTERRGQLQFDTKGEKLIRCTDRQTVNTHPYQFKLEIFISQPEYYGYTLFIRTGSRDWNHAFMTHCTYKLGYQITNNMFIKDGVVIQFSDESEIFSFLGVKYAEPPDRMDKNAFHRLLKIGKL